MLFANRVFAGAPSTVFRMSYYSERAAALYVRAVAIFEVMLALTFHP